MPPEVSIIILSYYSPEVTDICLRQLQKLTIGSYEVVVVDNSSGDPETVAALEQHRDEGRIDTLVLNNENTWFSKGNNIGTMHADPGSTYFLYLNSDVAVIHPEWLIKTLDWMEGRAKHWPTIWGLNPTVPLDEPKDILSVGWSHDATILPGMVRPEGWCLMIRRTWWRSFDENFPHCNGWEHTASQMIRDGARCGVLSNYSKYMVHLEGGSRGSREEIVNIGAPDMGGWFSGLPVESLDFTLGPNEHRSYLDW